MSYPTKKLGEVCEIISPGIKKFEGSKKYIATADVDFDEIINFTEITYNKRPNRANIETKENDVLVARMAETKKFLVADKKLQDGYIFSTGFAVLRTKNDLLPKCLFYFLTTKDFNLQKSKLAVGATQKAINNPAIKKIKIPLPPLAIQKQIVERLDKITSAQKLNGELIQKTDELFQSLLHKELNPAGKDWEVRKLGEVCEKTEQSHPSKFFKESFHYIDISSINGGGKAIQTFSTCSVKQAPSRARKLVKKNDILFATTRPYLENIAMVPHTFDDFVASTGFCVIRANAKYTTPDFLFFNVISKSFIKKVLTFQRGANYPAVSDKNVYDIKISLPSLKTQKKIVENLSAVQDYKKQLLEQKLKLKELFDSVLHKSMATRN